MAINKNCNKHTFIKTIQTKLYLKMQKPQFLKSVIKCKTMQINLKSLILFQVFGGAVVFDQFQDNTPTTIVVAAKKSPW